MFQMDRNGHFDRAFLFSKRLESSSNPIWSSSNPIGSIIQSHRIHVWYIYLHLLEFHGTCRSIYHTRSKIRIWVIQFSTSCRAWRLQLPGVGKKHKWWCGFTIATQFTCLDLFKVNFYPMCSWLLFFDPNYFFLIPIIFFLIPVFFWSQLFFFDPRNLYFFDLYLFIFLIP